MMKRLMLTIGAVVWAIALPTVTFAVPPEVAALADTAKWEPLGDSGVEFKLTADTAWTPDWRHLSHFSVWVRDSSGGPPYHIEFNCLSQPRTMRLVPAPGRPEAWKYVEPDTVGAGLATFCNHDFENKD